jgi:archaellum biogenesis ATPase FlaH
MDRIEKTILKNLVHDEVYMRQVFPFLRPEYFTATDGIVFRLIAEFIDNYNNCPSTEALDIAIQKKNLNEGDFKASAELIKELVKTDVNTDWLLTETERFCKDKAVYNAILKSIEIIDGRDKKHTTEALPSILSEALSVGFDNSVGHDYLLDAASRFDFYHRVETRIPFDLEYFNKITNGGMPNKTLNVVLAGTGVGKSLFMCHVAAATLAQNKNVLYITMEMAEERIAERIDANLMNLDMDQLHDLPKTLYDNRIDKIKDKTHGRLIIKEYPTAGAHCGHFKSLLNELSLKQSFHPDIIIVDYLNICTSSRIKQGAGVNSYTYIKAIAEEMRGLAVEHNVPILSATQTTRGGYANTDVDLTDTSESFGLPATVDFMFALISTEELEGLNQLMVKQLKNRYNDPTTNRKFMIGVDRAKMKLYDVEATAQKGLSQSGQEPDVDTKFGSSIRTTRDFSDIKF